MAQETNKGVLWTVVVGVILAIILLGGFMVVNSKVNQATADAKAQATALDTKVNTAINNIPTAADLAALVPPTPTAAEIAALIPAAAASNDDYTYVGGDWTVNGQYVVGYYGPNSNNYVCGYDMRTINANMIMTKLQEFNRIRLFDAIKVQAEVDTRYDINWVALDEIGTVLTNYAPERCRLDGRIVQVPMTIKVNYKPNGGSDAYTKEFLVHAEVYDILEGNPGNLAYAKVRVISIEKVPTNYVIP
jgi:hypothetical protein